MFTICAVGNLTRDPEKSDNENAPVRICVAINDPFHKPPDDVTFLDCEVWGKTRGFVLEYLTKGSRVAISGTGYTHHWTSRDGQKEEKQAIRCSIDRVAFAGPKPREDEDDAIPARAQHESDAGEPADDDLPF